MSLTVTARERSSRLSDLLSLTEMWTSSTGCVDRGGMSGGADGPDPVAGRQGSTDGPVGVPMVPGLWEGVLCPSVIG